MRGTCKHQHGERRESRSLSHEFPPYADRPAAGDHSADTFLAEREWSLQRAVRTFRESRSRGFSGKVRQNRPMLTIGLIGDFDESVPAHRAIPLALRMAADRLGMAVEFEWVLTEEIGGVDRVSGFAGLWCVPASPYRSMEGALRAIRFARESGRPFLGTCGGFQHAVIELARNVLGWADAEHAETAPDARRPVITLLECALVEATGTVRLEPGSKIRAAYGRDEAQEGYRCRYGLNSECLSALISAGLRVVARDGEGEVRGLELSDHPFFVLTLFQPERAALRGECPPLVTAYLRALQKA